MASPSTPLFAARTTAQDAEVGLHFQPKLDADGLIAAIVTEKASGQLLMVAWMNAEALARTIETRRAHFYSRSRGRLWIKGEESGNLLDVAEMRVDCDQDAVQLIVEIRGHGVACHTGRASCFYRSVPLGEPPTAQMKLVPLACDAPGSHGA
jgi:phosphoribosyl-AMP cyclohydrolase